jgi:phosphoribosylglycinamide formyltransferase 2
MVTLAGTQNLNEFELHTRAILGLPIPQIELWRAGVSAVILATASSSTAPTFTGVETALETPQSDIKLFGKPSTRPYRRMGVALSYDEVGADMDALRKKAKALADQVKVDSSH